MVSVFRWAVERERDDRRWNRPDGPRLRAGSTARAVSADRRRNVGPDGRRPRDGRARGESTGGLSPNGSKIRSAATTAGDESDRSSSSENADDDRLEYGSWGSSRIETSGEVDSNARRFGSNNSSDPDSTDGTSTSSTLTREKASRNRRRTYPSPTI
ncbi:hypothetical protein D8S78_02135 [Natrialba swarupiae]|nr:hypothetical protein [Natrialba swarupiae]